MSNRIRKLIDGYEHAKNVVDRKIFLAALTYVFDPEDYIHDCISAMGFLDDLYVLRAACVLLDCNR